MKYEKYCKCGCGTELIPKKWWKPSDYPRYIRGHWIKGEGNPNWKGGKKLDHYGYIQVLMPDHHFANNHGYVREHRLVYEYYNLCCLLPWAVIHHIDGNRSNNDYNNLELITQSKHMSIHFTKCMDNRICSVCGSNKTRIRKDGYINWYGNEKDGFKCDKCHEREYRLSGKRKLNKLKKSVSKRY